MIRRRSKLLIALAISLMALPAAQAIGYVEMPIYSLSPANGSHLTMTPRETSTPVVIKSLPPEYFNMIAGIVLEVSSTNTLGKDGTLSDDFVFDYDYIQPSDTADGYYTTRFQNWRYNFPGTKYFDFWGYTWNHEFMKSPVFSFVYEPLPPTPTPTPNTLCGPAQIQLQTAMRKLRELKRRQKALRYAGYSAKSRNARNIRKAKYRVGAARRYVNSVCAV